MTEKQFLKLAKEKLAELAKEKEIKENRAKKLISIFADEFTADEMMDIWLDVMDKRKGFNFYDPDIEKDSCVNFCYNVTAQRNIIIDKYQLTMCQDIELKKFLKDNDIRSHTDIF